MAIKRTIYLLTKQLDVIIDYTHGTTLPPFQFSVADFDLSGAAVTAYNAGESKKLKKILCDVNENVISFSPVGGFFELGNNGLQLRITKDGKDLFSFMCFVKCHDSYEVDDAVEVEENPTLLAQLLSQIGKIDEEKVTEAEMMEKIGACHNELSAKIENEKAERETAISGEKAEREKAITDEETARKAEIAVERERINQFTALKAGSTTGDAELMDARVDHTGKTHKNLGEHVRKATGELYEEKLGYMGYIDSDIDFDALVDVGIYNVLNEALAGSLNYPSKSGGLLTVTKRTGYDVPVAQTLIDNKGIFYTRYKTLSSGWSEWVESISRTEYDEHVTNSLCYKTYIDSAMDIDELIVPGVYNVLSSAVDICEHYPSKLGGMLTVKRRLGYEYPVGQELTDTSGRFFVRYKTSVGWSEWSKFVYKDEYEEHVTNSLCYKTYIDSAMDIDELITPGIYNVLSQAAGECLHYPSKRGGMVTVKRRIGHEYPIVQELTDTGGNFYIRYKTSLSWGEWSEMITKEKLKEEIAKTETYVDGIGALVNVAETYFNVAYDHNDQLLYNTKRGLFAENPKDDNGIKSIVCSQFAQACIGAIQYQHSRYVKDSNDALPWGFVSDGSGVYAYTNWNPYNDYMTACEQAKYFENHGLLQTFDRNRNGLKPGDLLYYTKDDVDEDIYYRKITHVAICLGITKDRHTVMHSNDNRARLVDGLEAGVMVDTYYYDNYAPAYFVHSPVSAEYSSRLVASKVLAKSGDYTGNASAYIDKMVFDEPLEQGFYTLNFDDAGDSYGYIKVYYGNGTSTNYEGGKAAGVNNIVFYAEMPITQIELRAALGTNYNCTWAKLYRGYHN